MAVLGSPSLIVLNNDGLCGRKATLEEVRLGHSFRGQELCESGGGGPPGLPDVKQHWKKDPAGTTKCRRCSISSKEACSSIIIKGLAVGVSGRRES